MKKPLRPPKLDKTTSNFWDIVLIINWTIDYIKHLEVVIEAINDVNEWQDGVIKIIDKDVTKLEERIKKLEKK